MGHPAMNSSLYPPIREGRLVGGGGGVRGRAVGAAAVAAVAENGVDRHPNLKMKQFLIGICVQTGFRAAAELYELTS